MQEQLISAMANQIESIEGSTVITSPADKFYNFFKYNTTDLVKVFPAAFTVVQVIEGVAGTVGYVLGFTYIIGGATLTAKLQVEKIDDTEKSLTFVVVEGDVLQQYKSFAVIVNVSEGFAKCTIEYEKATLIAPPPELYITTAMAAFNLVDAYLLIN